MYVDYVEVGRRIAKKRKALGMKQYEVNEIAGLSDKYLSNIETARSIPSVDVLMRICDAINATPDEILLGAVSDYRDTEYDRQILEKIKKLDKKKQLFVYNFIDWLVEQGI